MYLLYLDESGTQSGARHFVLAGVAIYEHSIYWPTEALNDLQAQYFPDIAESVRFHAAPLRTADGESVEAPIDRLPATTRRRLLTRLYDVLHNMHGRLFAVVIEKAGLAGADDPYERALEEILYRFDRFLSRMHRDNNRRNKGLVVIADSQDRNKLERASQQFLTGGTRHGKVHNILDIPFFTRSRNSRPLQIADLVANTVYGRYEHGYATQFDRLLPKFDQTRNGPVHGLVHLPAEPAPCYQPCCRP